MPDRHDSLKGRYVRYDYEPKGDRFERGLSETPRVYDTVYHCNTGNTYKRRKRTDELPCLNVPTVRKRFPDVLKEAWVEQGVFVFYDWKKSNLDLSLEPFAKGPPFKLPCLHVGFELTEQHKGTRLWFLCPYCERRVGKLFVYALSFLHRWGCQKCLGLSYPSQYAHKTVTRDWAILQGEVRVELKELYRAEARINKRLGRITRRVDSLYEQLNPS